MEFKVIGFDPGETTGWAILDQDGKMLNGGNVRSVDGKGRDAGIHPDLADLLDSLDSGEFRQVIIESYVVLPGKQMAHTGRPVLTEQIVGVLKLWAARHRIKVTTYPSSKKSIQQKHSGFKPTGAHKDTHYVDAYNHAWWWLFTNKYVSSKLQISKGVKNG